MNRAARRKAARLKATESHFLHAVLDALLGNWTPTDKALREIGRKFNVTMLYISDTCPGCQSQISSNTGVMIGRCPEGHGAILHAQCKACADRLLSGDIAPADAVREHLISVLEAPAVNPGQVLEA